MRDDENRQNRNTSKPDRTISLPGWLMHEEEVGLGTAIKRLSSHFGMRPCSGCDRRAEALNEWIAFNRRQQR